MEALSFEGNSLLGEPSFSSTKGYSVDLEESFKANKKSPIKSWYTPKLQPDEVAKKVNRFRKYLRKMSSDESSKGDPASLRNIGQRRLQHMLDVSYVQDRKKSAIPKLTPLDPESRREHLKMFSKDAQSALDAETPAILKRQKLKPISSAELDADGEHVPHTSDQRASTSSPRTEVWKLASVAGGKEEKEWLRRVRDTSSSATLTREEKDRTDGDDKGNEDFATLWNEGVELHDLGRLLNADSGRLPSRQDVYLVEFWLSQMLDAKGLLSSKRTKQRKASMQNVIEALRTEDSFESVDQGSDASLAQEIERFNGPPRSRSSSRQVSRRDREERKSRPSSAASTRSRDRGNLSHVGETIVFKPLRNQLPADSPLGLSDNSPTRYLLECYSVALFELIRQAGINCKERGELMLLIWTAYVQTLEGYLQDTYLERIDKADETISSHIKKLEMETRRRELEFANTRKDLDKQVVALKKDLERVKVERDMLSAASQKLRDDVDEVRDLLDGEIRSHKETMDKFQKWKLQEHERRMLFEKNVARARKQLDSEQDKNRSIRRELDRMAQKLASLDAKYGSVIEEFEGEAVITQEDGQTTTVSAGDDLVKEVARLRSELEMEKEARQYAEKEAEEMRIKVRFIRSTSQAQMRSMAKLPRETAQETTQEEPQS